MSLLTPSLICMGASTRTHPHTELFICRLSIVLFSISLSVSIICYSFDALLLFRIWFVVHFDCFVHFGHIYRWLVRVFDGSDNAKEGWVPASILEAQQMETAIYGDRVDDAAFRREYVFNIALVANEFYKDSSCLFTAVHSLQFADYIHKTIFGVLFSKT